jgi:hypothetical protein
VKLLWYARGARPVLGFNECASEGGGRASGVRAARNGRGEGRHDLGVHHGCGIHGVRTGRARGRLGGTVLTGGVHGPAREGVRTGGQR